MAILWKVLWILNILCICQAAVKGFPLLIISSRQLISIYQVKPKCTSSDPFMTSLWRIVPETFESFSGLGAPWVMLQRHSGQTGQKHPRGHLIRMASKWERKPVLAAEEESGGMTTLQYLWGNLARTTATCNSTRNKKHQTDFVLEPAWQGNFIFDWVAIKRNKR